LLVKQAKPQDNAERHHHAKPYKQQAGPKVSALGVSLSGAWSEFGRGLTGALFLCHQCGS
jgi:hypothetical protein